MADVSLDVNQIIGKLHDAAMANVKKSGSKFFSTMIGARNVYIVNTGIQDDGSGKGSLFRGGKGPYEIRATKEGLLTSKSTFIRLVGEYIKWFAGLDNVKVEENAVKNIFGKVSGIKMFSVQYTVQYRENLPPKIPKMDSPKDKEGKEKEDKEGSTSTSANSGKFGDGFSDSDEVITASQKSDLNKDKLVKETGNKTRPATNRAINPDYPNDPWLRTHPFAVLFSNEKVNESTEIDIKKVIDEELDK